MAPRPVTGRSANPTATLEGSRHGSRLQKRTGPGVPVSRADALESVRRACPYAPLRRI